MSKIDLPDGSIDMILADLPYGTNHLRGKLYHLNRYGEQYVIKPNGAIVLTPHSHFTSALVMSNPKMFR